MSEAVEGGSIEGGSSEGGSREGGSAVVCGAVRRQNEQQEQALEREGGGEVVKEVPPSAHGLLPHRADSLTTAAQQ